MVNDRELDLREVELEIRRDELEIRRAQLAVDFAKFGFRGTLFAGVSGMVLLLAMAVLSAFTSFRIEASAFIGIGLMVLLGTIAFGYFSLWEIPKLAAQFSRLTLSLNAADRAGEPRRRSEARAMLKER